MLTKLTVRNFKRFNAVEVELGNPVVFVGPNDSGKTTALQALSLWEIGLKRWLEKRHGKQAPEKRPGVAINRKDLISIPAPNANLLWRNLRVRDALRDSEGKSLGTQNVRIDVIVEGVSDGTAWECGLEFDYANEESFYCRPLRLGDADKSERMVIPPESAGTRIAYLPPMSGLAANETRLDAGAVNVRLGEGRTAEVLRNLCHQLVSDEARGDSLWHELKESMADLFGVQISRPVYIPERGEIAMAYQSKEGIELDLSCSGRGMQQTLLLLAHLMGNPNSVLLLDEPDAHLEILRQRQIYEALTETAKKHGSQVIVASHSEVVLNEAADRHVVVAFVGRPHRIDDRGRQTLKSLRDIGFEQYYMAEQQGWVLYLEGSTDLSILQAFAKKLNHPVAAALAQPCVYYVENKPQKAYEHFYGIREAKKDLVGIALFDRLDRVLDEKSGLAQRAWGRREIESYLCQRETLFSWVEEKIEEFFPLYGERAKEAMSECIQEVEAAMQTLGKGSPWGPDTKVSDDFLTPLFTKFFQRMGLPDLMRKSAFHELATHVVPDAIDPEVVSVLDAILDVAQRAAPRLET